MDKALYMLDTSSERMKENVLEGVSQLLDEYISNGGQMSFGLTIRVHHDYQYHKDMYEFRIKN